MCFAPASFKPGFMGVMLRWLGPPLSAHVFSFLISSPQLGPTDVISLIPYAPKKKSGGTDDAVGVCAGAVEPDDVDMEIELEAGMRRPDRKAALEAPAAQERAEQMFTHMPFRSWCRHCIRGRGKEEPCRQGQEDPEHSEVHVDYMLMWQDVGDPRGGGPVVEGG